MSDKATVHFMQRSIELGRYAMKLGNAPVGAVLVFKDEIVGEGLELSQTKNDITFHAEIEAIRDALTNLNTHKLPDTIIYTTHEPCLMCSYAIRHYQIKKVVYGLSVKDIGGHTSGFDILQTKTVSNWVPAPEVIGRFMETACRVLNNEYNQLKADR